MITLPAFTPGSTASERRGTGRSTLLVGRGVDGRRLGSALASRWESSPPASLHAVAIECTRPWWNTWAEWDLCLAGGLWELYEETWLSHERAQADRLAELERGLARVAPPATFEIYAGPLRQALKVAPSRWPGSTLIVAGHWHRLPRRLSRWTADVELLPL